MIRLLILSALFLTVAAIELSFISALSPTLRTIPFVFSFSIALLQHHGVRAGAWYVAAFGVLLDALGLSSAFPSTPGAVLAAVAADRFSRDVFSNRSYYGLLGCGLSAFGIQTAWQALVLGFRGLFLDETIRWSAAVADAAMSVAWLVVWLSLFFFAAGGLRRVLGSAFVIPESRRTLN